MYRLTILLILSFCAISTAAQNARPPQDRAWLGFGYTYERTAGSDGWLHVRHVLPNGPAARAGLQPYDVIMKIDGKTLRFSSDSQVIEFLRQIKVGQRIRLTVRRKQEARQVILTAAALPGEYAERWKMNTEMAKQHDGEKRAQPEHPR
ncbi:MAG TPA: PDZ domain-containing protein [Thermoanaerobaculia bacterium]|nr:PDZ domain-containing protein [Thermoanaerobaculia bacterium]